MVDLQETTNDPLFLIESWLLLTPHREQFSSSDVEDLLLDLRAMLVSPAVPA